jgi:hypothetical protein
VQQERAVNQDHTLRIANHTLQIEKNKWRGTPGGSQAPT